MKVIAICIVDRRWVKKQTGLLSVWNKTLLPQGKVLKSSKYYKNN
jgi:hypothetical protein